MTAKELKMIRKKLGLTQEELGFWLNPYSPDPGREVRRREAGGTITGHIETTIRMFDNGARPMHIGPIKKKVK